MSKITKNSILILAFFIFGVFFEPDVINAQDIKTFDNGLKVIIEENHKSPIVSISSFIDVGSSKEAQYLGSGISHLIEHMLFKGTKNYPANSIESTLHQCGGDINAFTSYDYTGIRITILKEHVSIALDILEDMLSEPTFNKNELLKEKDVIEREMALGDDDPGKKISRLTFSTAYNRHPYKIPIIGYKETFAALGQKDVMTFFKENYIPQKIVIAIVGDIDSGAIAKELNDRFGRKKRGPDKIVSNPKEPKQLSTRYVEQKAIFDGAYLNMAFHSTSMANDDLYAMDVLSFLLGQGEGSRLNESLRIDKKIVLSVSSYNYTPCEPGLFVISCVLKEEKVNEALKELLDQLELLREGAVTEKELERAKNNFLSGYIREKESFASRSNDLAIGSLSMGDCNFFDTYIEKIRSVTKEDIARVSKKYLTSENMTIAVLSRSGQALALDINKAAEKQDRAIKKIVLENNLPILISKDDSLPIIAISVVLKGGVRIENKDNNGISNLASNMLISGTEAMPRKEVIDLYESKGMSVETYSGNNSLGITLTSLKEYTEDALQFLSTILMGSNVPEEEFGREKNEVSTAISMQDDDIFTYGSRLLKKELFKDHSYRFQVIGEQKSIENIKREDVSGFLKNVVSSENMAVGISGDIDTSTIEELAKKYFSKIPYKKSVFQSPLKERPIENPRSLEIATDKTQSLVLIGFHGISIYDKDKAAFDVMSDMLSRESGVIFQNIRGENALSYAQGAFQMMGVDPGYIAIYALTSKKDIDKVKGLVFSEIRSFKKNGPPEEELERSKNHLKAVNEMRLHTNSSFIFSVSLDELYGLGYDNYIDYNKRVGKVTQENIKDIAKKILDLEKTAIVVLKGKE
ncbi:MAG: pitrilysin family protein [Candidatus Omnitrophota bacterium]